MVKSHLQSNFLIFVCMYACVVRALKIYCLSKIQVYIVNNYIATINYSHYTLYTIVLYTRSVKFINLIIESYFFS